METYMNKTKLFSSKKDIPEKCNGKCSGCVWSTIWHSSCYPFFLYRDAKDILEEF